jgi:hypothetical protein
VQIPRVQQLRRIRTLSNRMQSNQMQRMRQHDSHKR